MWFNFFLSNLYACPLTCLLHWLGLLTEFHTEVVRVNMLALYLILSKNYSIFNIRVLSWLFIFHRYL